VDAARPESDTARLFRREVDRLLSTDPKSGGAAGVRATLLAWRDNHARLEPVLPGSPAAEALSLSRDLADVAALGLEALEHLSSGQAPGNAWREQAARRLDGAALPRAEVELAVVPAVRKLVLAAEHVETLAAMSPPAWSDHLDAQLEALKPAPSPHA
jgi:hexosaminidase